MVGHHNPFQWATVYLVDMIQISETDDDLYSQFRSGQHTVNRAECTFGNVWPDMALEQSANCQSKSRKGGTVGITKSEQAHER